MSEDTLTIEIDGRSLEARKGQMIIHVADAAGIRIPRFCYHPKLSIAANCRMCLVDVEKAPKPLPACATPVMPGMKVRTRSPLARGAQKAVMEFLLINHPLDCPICDQGGECELQDVAMGYGAGVSRFVERKRVVADKDIGPLISTDMTRCIHCTRCVRFGEEIGGMPELGATGRSENMEIGTFIEKSVDSEMSGNVIDLCPVGALTSKPFRFRARAWEMQQRATIAPHDPVGSNLHLHIARGRVMRAVPHENEAINEVWIPDRDRFSYEGLYSDDRIGRPVVRRDGEWMETDWPTALEFAAAGLRRVVDKRGAERLGALGSASATTEELFLLQKLVRGLGSPNVDHRVRQSDFRDDDETPLFPALGLGIEALEDLDAVLLVGSWARKEHPMINHRLRKASKRGCRIMLVNAADWDTNVPVHARIVTPPSGIPGALAGIAAAAGTGATKGRQSGLAEGLAPLLAGLSSDDTSRGIAETLGGSERAAILLGPGALNHPDASVLRSLAAYAAEQTSATLGFLAEGGNAPGAWLAGMLPHRRPGGEAAPARGLDAAQMLAGDLDALVLLGLEPERDGADSAGALAAIRRADFVVSLSGYRTAKMDEYASVILPIAGFAETSGTYVNLEGTWQSFEGAVRPVGESRPAWKVLRVLGNLLGLTGFEHVDSAEVLDELRQLVGESAGSGAGAWTAPQALPSPGAADGIERIGDFPAYAVDALVRRAPALQRTRDSRLAGIYLNPALAAELGLEEGASARISQNGSSTVLDVGLDERIPVRAVRIPGGVEASEGLGGLYAPVEISSA